MEMSVILKLAFILLASAQLERTLGIPQVWDGSFSISTRSGSGGKDKCNCTSLFQCDLSSAESSDDGSKEVISEFDKDDEEDGADLEVIDIRNGLSSSNSNFACKHYLEICCNHFQRTSQPKHAGTSLVGRPAQPPPPPKTLSAGFQQCGRRNAHGVGFRIVGDIEGEAQMGEFTWMIAVTELSKDKQGTVYICGGSLIHPRVILTAAHCVENKITENLRIRAGEWDTQTEREDPYVHYDRLVSKVVVHEDYRKRGVLKNDIAIILLSKEIPLARHIGTVCLTPDLHPKPGQRCYASGWGKNLYGKEGSYQSILKKIDLPIVSRDECQSAFRETRLGPNFKLHESFVCAGGERGRDTCKGDGGSPLVCQVPGSDHYAQYGIVSWGLNCGEPIPGAYVNVPYFVPWIEGQMREFGLDPSYFKNN